MEGTAAKTNQNVKASGPDVPKTQEMVKVHSDNAMQLSKKPSSASCVSSTDGDSTPRGGDDDGKNKKKVVKLEPIFFKLTDKLDREAINDYRLKYREFRTGKAFGAHGEIEKETIVASDPVDTIVPPFIAKLTSMLSNNMYAEFVDWSDDGKNVVVKKVAEFSAAILPKYFKHKNFTSFLRQLNMYGFHTARQGKNWREFRNDLFQRDLPKDHCKIKRRKGDEKSGTIPNGKVIDPKLKKKKKNDEEQATSLLEVKEALSRSNDKIFALEAQVYQMHKILEKVQMDLALVRGGANKKKATGPRKRKAHVKTTTVPSGSPSLSADDLDPLSRGFSDFLSDDHEMMPNPKLLRRTSTNSSVNNFNDFYF